MLHQVRGYSNLKKLPDAAMVLLGHDSQYNKPFWIHESCISKGYDYVSEKAQQYLRVPKSHVSILSMLNMNDTETSGWEVELSIWRFKSERTEKGKRRWMETLVDRVKVYPDPPSPPPKVTISKQDLVTVHRERNPRLCEDEIEIDFSFVHQNARNAVRAKIREQQNLPRSSPEPFQSSHSPPLKVGSDHSLPVTSQSESQSSLGSTGHSQNEANMEIKATVPSTSSQEHLPARRTNNKRTMDKETGEPKEGGERSGSGEPERSRKRPRPS